MRGQNGFTADFKTGITQKQIYALLDFTKNDSLVKKYTSDNNRFSNVSSFKKWSQGKTIYTAVSKEKLLGIIWFSPKESSFVPGYLFTLGIRIYGDARGKGLSEIFLEKSITEFVKSRLYLTFKSKGFWLAVRNDNNVAQKVYRKTGFRLVKAEKNSVYMKKRI